MLTHLHMDYEKYGHLDNVSTFQFESYLGKLKSMITSGSLPVKQLIGRLYERKNIQVKRKKENTIKKGDIYLINNCKNCVVVISINSNNIYCKLYKLLSLYEYPSESDLFGIYRGIVSGHKTIIPTHLYHRGILFNTALYYDDDITIIQSIQHYYR